MADCILETPLSQVADDFDKKVLGKYMPTPTKTTVEAKERFQFYNKNFELREATDDEKRGYGVKGSPTITKETFTSEATRKFEKVKGKAQAKEISERPDNVILRDTGINMHSTIHDLILHHTHNTFKDNADSVEGPHGKTPIQMQRESGLGDNEFHAVDRMVKQLVSNAVDRQKEIDPKEKVLLAPEQKLIKNRDIGGTADLVVVYSNQNHSTYDFKTLYPKTGTSWNEEAQARRLTDPNWIPFYHYEDWSMQLPKINECLRDGTKLGGSLEQSRVIPIQVDFAKEKGKDGKYHLTDKVTQVRTFADDNDFLSQIPIQEKTGNAALDANINKMLTLRHNVQLELDKVGHTNYQRSEYLKSRIDHITTTVNKLVVKQDVSSLIYDYAKVVQRFGQINNMLVIEKLNPSIRDTTSKNFMDLNQLMDLKAELDTFSSILNSSSTFYNKIGADLHSEDPEFVEARRIMGDNAEGMSAM